MYASSLTVGEARSRYFADSGFDETSYTDRWVRLKLGPIPLAFPNTAGRKAAVKLHDLHHLATGYDTSWTGEAEIAAWEIGAGCGRHGAAWALNTMAMAMGLIHSPRRVLRALARGRRSTSLYRTTYSDAMLGWSLGELRDRLGIPR